MSAPLAELGKKSKRGAPEEARQTKNEESTITFLVFRTVPRGFLCVLATPRRTQFRGKNKKKGFGRKRPYARALPDRLRTGSLPPPELGEGTTQCRQLHLEPWVPCLAAVSSESERGQGAPKKKKKKATYLPTYFF